MSLRLERNVFLKLLSQILKLFACSMFEFLQPFGIRLFKLVRQPKTFRQIEPDDAKDHDHQQHFAYALEIADHTHHRAAEKVTGAGENEYPQETTGERERQETQVRHAPDSIKHTRSPAQTVNIFRKKNRERTEFVSQLFQARLGGA